MELKPTRVNPADPPPTRLDAEGRVVWSPEVEALLAAAIRDELSRCLNIAEDLARRLRRDRDNAAREDDAIAYKSAETLEQCATAADEIARAIREGAPAPAWTRQPPTVSGWYWTRTDAGEVEPVLVAESPTGTWWANGNRLTEYADREWCGPIEEPIT